MLLFIQGAVHVGTSRRGWNSLSNKKKKKVRWQVYVINDIIDAVVDDQ